MSITQKIKNLNLSQDTMVTFTYSQGTDVFVHNETEVETALADTDVVSTFASLVATPGLRASNRWAGEVMDSLRSEGYLDDYERGSFAFEDYIAEVLTDNFYDQEFIEYSTEKYDHKRGFCTLSAEVQIPVSDIISSNPYLGCWTVSVPTENGTLTFNE